MQQNYSYKKQAILKAAALARGDRLNRLYAICENQKTISTKKLQQLLDDLLNDMKLDAIFLRELSKRLSDE